MQPRCRLKMMPSYIFAFPLQTWALIYSLFYQFSASTACRYIYYDEKKKFVTRSSARDRKRERESRDPSTRLSNRAKKRKKKEPRRNYSIGALSLTRQGQRVAVAHFAVRSGGWRRTSGNLITALRSPSFFFSLSLCLLPGIREPTG